MKRILTALLCLVLALSLTACGSGSSDSGSVTTDMTAREMYDAIAAAAPMSSPAELDEAAMNDLFYVDSSWTDDFVVAMTQTNVSSDNLAIIHATEGNAQNVADALQKRIDDVKASFEQYLPEQADKASEALLITRGNWVFMAINDDYDAVETAIDGFFK